MLSESLVEDERALYPVCEEEVGLVGVSERANVIGRRFVLMVSQSGMVEAEALKWGPATAKTPCPPF